MDYFVPGVLPSPEDYRDYTVSTSSLPNGLPEKITIEFSPTIRTQKYATCAAHTGCYIAEYFFKKYMSASFLYGYRAHTDNQGMGICLRDLMKTMTKVGFIENDVFPEEYEAPEIVERINMDLTRYADAATENKLYRYARIFTQAELDAALYNGYPVIFSVNVDSAILDDKNRYTCPPSGNSKLHAMSIWGKDKPFTLLKSAFYRVLNTWGAEWGDGGYCWMLWEDISRQNDVWVLIDDDRKNKDIEKIPFIRQTLRRGINGNEVAQVKTKLNALGYSVGILDGAYNRNAEFAIKNFQRKHRLDCDGVVGKETWNMLDEFEGALIDLPDCPPEAFVRLYRSPKKEYLSNGIMLNGDYVVILERYGDLYKIRNEMLTGYIDKKYLKTH